jgi:hypothetical protein
MKLKALKARPGCSIAGLDLSQHVLLPFQLRCAPRSSTHFTCVFSLSTPAVPFAFLASIPNRSFHRRLPPSHASSTIPFPPRRVYVGRSGSIRPFERSLWFSTCSWITRSTRQHRSLPPPQEPVALVFRPCQSPAGSSTLQRAIGV